MLTTSTVLRTDSWRASHTREKIMLRRDSRYYLCHLHISPRHRPHPIIHPKRIFQRPVASRSRKAITGNGSNISTHVQDRRRLLGVVSRDNTHHRRSSTIRRPELHGVRECTAILHTRRPAEPHTHRQAMRRSHLRSRCSEHHISIVRPSPNPQHPPIPN